MNIQYLILRLIRHIIPEKIARALLKRRLIIIPGLETREPVKAVERYQTLLQKKSLTLIGMDVMVFGYGGSLAIAVELLQFGCAHATLCDLYPPTDKHINDHLFDRYGQYLIRDNDVVIPNSKWITSYHGDIRKIPDVVRLGPYDLILSSSVYEHLDDVNGITAALCRLLKPSGFFMAFIDLRDHYFKYPFEMLCYTKKVWEKWLNPTSNLNRYRIWDYRNIFERYFNNTQIDILDRDMVEHKKIKHRILDEFKTGNVSQDSVTNLVVLAAEPVNLDYER